uniref:Rib/alpha-like domain-containing protein n=1 Tax=Ligilactobacillus murinus TaxID=1622 RepID=UPI0021E72033
VTYPDGTTEEVTVPVKVGTDAQINEPTAQEVKTPVGDTPEATTGIANLDELPKGTTVAWKEPVDTKTPGHKEGTVVVTYPDGTTEEVTVPVKVGTDADIYTPNGQEVKTPVGGTPEATTGIKNLDEL